MKYDIRIVLSAQDTAYSKRDPELYKFFLDKFGLKADECLFVDDEIEKIAAAEKAGLKTWLLTKSKSLSESLRHV
ncbi:HAD-IA family hydrolase [Candidatus Falkowbacteria bacterium]|nr:HAD-IA family hydrolase [Candidatus Falkowbacteria bacterium]